jgi:hypothetical protein
VSSAWDAEAERLVGGPRRPQPYVIDSCGREVVAYNFTGSSFGTSRWITRSAVRYANAAMKNTGT